MKRLTSVKVSLFGKFIVRVTVSIDGSIELFERHQGVNQLIVGMKQSSQPLFMLDVVNLSLVSISYSRRLVSGENSRNVRLYDEGVYTSQNERKLFDSTRYAPSLD